MIHSHLPRYDATCGDCMIITRSLSHGMIHQREKRFIPLSRVICDIKEKML